MNSLLSCCQDLIKLTNKAMKKFFIALICTLATLSCSSSGDKPSGDKPSGNVKGGGKQSYLIDAFMNVSEIDFSRVLTIGENPRNCNVALEGESAPRVHTRFRGDIIPEEEAKRLRKELGDYGGDYSSGIYGPVVVPINNFIGIDAISDAQFNDVAPGESLGDIVVLNWLSAAPTIEAKNNYIYEPKPSSKLIREITETDLFLIQDEFYLIFTETPAIKEHNITVSFMDKDTTITGTGHFVFK